MPRDPRSAEAFDLARYDRTTTALDVVEGLDLAGRRALVTGASSGFGAEIARALAAAGASVAITGRDLDATRGVAAGIERASGRPVAVHALELADPASIDALAASWEGPLDILVNNAGVMGLPETRTDRGWELTMVTNHLGPMRLALGLLDALRRSEGARVVAVSSATHLRGPVVTDDLFFRFRTYEANQAYSQSKAANVLFAVEADRRWSGDGIRVNAVHPGSAQTGLYRHQFIDLAPYEPKTPEQGAATPTLVAAHPAFAEVGGRYIAEGREAEVVDRTTPDLSGVARHAVSAETAERLWRVSEALLATW